jgi:hypothetical protein
MALGLPGIAVCDFSTLEVSSAPLPSGLPEEFRKRALALNYDLAKLWAAFSRVKASYRSRNVVALWRVSRVPLLVIDNGRRFEVRSLSQLGRLSHIVFAVKIRNAVAQCNFTSLFLNSDGAMIGDGELWIRETCQGAECRNSKFLVSTIDVFG